MTLFIGWSKATSQAIAQAFRDWITQVHPKIFPFVSFEDIRPGMEWRKTLSQSLMKANFGVMCMTEENLNAPWLLYETGLLSMATSQNNPDGEARIAPVLFGVEHTGDLPDAIRPYQSVRYDDENAMWNLLLGMNELCVKLYGVELQKLGAAAEPTYLETETLTENFNQYYPELVKKVRLILESAGSPADASGAGSRPESAVRGAANDGNAAAKALQGAADGATRSGKASGDGAGAYQDNVGEFSRKLEEFYQEFGAYPDTARVYFEGRQLVDLLQDENARLKEKSGNLDRFLKILNEAAGNLNHTEAVPNKRNRLRALKALKSAFETL